MDAAIALSKPKESQAVITRKVGGKACLYIAFSLQSIMNNELYLDHANLLCNSFECCTGKSLLPLESRTSVVVEALFNAPFALVSHGTEEDPIFNFGNKVALALFELTWEQFTSLPSRKSAEPVNRDEHPRLLHRVTQKGYIDDYSGVRISATGK